MQHIADVVGDGVAAGPGEEQAHRLVERRQNGAEIGRDGSRPVLGCRAAEALEEDRSDAGVDMVSTGVE